MYFFYIKFGDRVGFVLPPIKLTEPKTTWSGKPRYPKKIFHEVRTYPFFSFHSKNGRCVRGSTLILKNAKNENFQFFIFGVSHPLDFFQW